MTALTWKGRLMAAGANAKTRKGDGEEYVTAIMYLAPADASGINVCPMAVLAGCKAPCLNSAGRGAMNSVQAARLAKTLWYHRDREGFVEALHEDIRKFKRWCARKGVKPAVRLNGTSDITWETVAPGLFTEHQDVMFYDYTKVAKRVTKPLPPNYRLTISYSEANEKYTLTVEDAIRKNPSANIAVVFRNKATIQDAIAKGLKFNGRPIIDGDRDDMRFLDPEGVVVALYAKGKAKHDTSGFVIG